MSDFYKVAEKSDLRCSVTQLKDFSVGVIRL